MNENEKALHTAVKGAVRKAAAHSLAVTLAFGFAFFAQSGLVSASSMPDAVTGSDVKEAAQAPAENPGEKEDKGEQAPADTATADFSESTADTAPDAVRTDAGKSGTDTAGDAVDVLLQITDEDGNAVSNSFVTFEDGRMYYAEENGVPAKNKVITVDGRNYFAKESGEIARKELCTLPDKTMYYALADRTLAADRTVSVNGILYYASSDGTIVKDGFYTTAKGSKIYAGARHRCTRS